MERRNASCKNVCPGKVTIPERIDDAGLAGVGVPDESHRDLLRRLRRKQELRLENPWICLCWSSANYLISLSEHFTITLRIRLCLTYIFLSLKQIKIESGEGRRKGNGNGKSARTRNVQYISLVG